MEFVVESNGKIFEISELVKSVSFSDKLNDGCSKLEFTYINDGLLLENGTVLYFKYNKTNIFYGYVFKISRGPGKEISVTAYDQLRYAKAKDYLYIKDYTLSSVVNKMCSHFNFAKGTITDTKYILKTQAFDGDTWLDIVYTGINDTLTNKGKMYCLRDEFGKITLRDLEELRLKLALGDNSLCYSYSHEKSIDDNFYNQILILAKDDTSTQFVGAKDENSIKKYGMLQYYESAQNSNASQAKAKAEALLKLYNQETTTLTLECLGDTRIRAGSSFFTYISDVSLNRQVYVKSVTHNFIPVHTMSIEVAI